MEKVKMEKAKVEKAKMDMGSGSSTRSRNSEEGTKWQRRALMIEARDEIKQKTRVIEQLIKTISEMKINLETKETVNDENEDEIVRKFEEFYV
ncbi:hypothetical protein F2Q69_00041068 [Brassica cretica]|uniref:Uncharacterized protein n=2 Tax=Brassica cretica TaxID=69181 RepID=A0A8S9NH57_BRACR|nr:hypothetical protein F2Q69_00041068 [Brassica cretica]KAF3565653.1 hypothetical protein DY000_02012708 [Brassica cretica]